MDIKSYFTSIDKNVMFELLKKGIEEEWLINLVEKVLFHDPKKNYTAKSSQRLFDMLPPYKSFFCIDESKGMPIGNLTSQFFSNIYLNELDQYVKRTLKCKYYIRYVDDIIIFDKDPKYLNWAYGKINRFLIEKLKMELNHKKKNIGLIRHGFDFLGKVIKPNEVVVRMRTRKKILKTVQEWKENKKFYDEKVLEKFKKSLDSYFGILMYTDSRRLRENISRDVNCLFTRTDKNNSKLLINAIAA